MTTAPNPVLLYPGDAYQIDSKEIKGRHAAGESFLAAFLAQSPVADIYGLCSGKKSIAHFTQAVQSCGRALMPHALGRNNVDAIRKQAILHIPAPGIAEEAVTRSFLGETAYALSGVTHTIASHGVLDSIAATVVAPVMPWDAIICTSQAVHDALSAMLDSTEERLRARLGASRFVRPMLPVAPLGIHATRFSRNPADRARWRRKLSIPEDAFTILFFGRLSVHAKASPFQLAQAAEAAANAAGKKFAVIWCGWFYDEVQRRSFMETAKSMAPSVAFYHVDGREEDARFTIWPAADAFCSLSDNIQESFGLTPIEAMAAGLPVVVSNWNGYRSTVEHGVSGILIDSYLPSGSLNENTYRHLSGLDDYDAYIGGISQFCFVDLGQITQWLIRLARDEGLRKQLGAAARKAAETAYDWSAVLPRYVEIWREQMERLTRARAAGPPSNDWRSYDAATTFSGFPSHHLSANSRLERGPQFDRWGEMLKQKGILVNASVLTGTNEYDATHRAFVKEGSYSIEEILRLFSEEKRMQVFRSLHWMIKIGLLRLSR